MALPAELHSATTHTKRGYFLTRLLTGSSEPSGSFLLELAFPLGFGLALAAFDFGSAFSAPFVGILGAEHFFVKGFGFRF